MNLSGTPIDIIQAVTSKHPEIPSILKQARAIVAPSPRAIAEYQAAALYALARNWQRNQQEDTSPEFLQRFSSIGSYRTRVLEIGTAQGYSAAILALAMPNASIITLNPHHEEATSARKALTQFGTRIEVIEQKSWDYLSGYDGKSFDFIFVDGDHKNVRRDFPWYEYLKVGGIILFHDFSPNGTPRACPPVYRALLELKADIGREFDVLVVDDEGVGMAGFVKQEADMLKNATKEALASVYAYSSASFSALVGLYTLAETHKDVEGALVECGVQNGGSAAALALGLGAGHQVWLFDNFTGVPKPMPEDGDKAMARYATNPDGWAKGDVALVRECFKTLGIKGAKVIEGDFADTFANNAYKTGKIACLHIDATVYGSTKLALERFYDHVVDGGLVIVSAYYHWQGIAKAVNDFLVQRADDPEFHQLEKVVWWAKPPK